MQGQAAWHANPVSWRELVDALPPVERQERVVRRRIRSPAEPRGHPKQWTHAIAECRRHPGVTQAQVRTQRGHPDLFARLMPTHHLIQAPSGARQGIIDKSRSTLAFSHGRPCCNHDEVARLKPAGDLVEVAEARRRAGQRRALARELLHLAQLVVEDLVDRAEVLLAVVVGDLEHRPLGLLDEIARRRGVVEHRRLDLVRRAQQAAHEGVLADDLRVAADPAEARHAAGQLVDRRLAAGLLELARRLQVLADREHVDRLALAIEHEHRLVDETMAVAVEVVGLQALLDDEAVHRPVGEQDATEHGLLGLERVRRGDAGGDRRRRARRRVGVRAQGPSRLGGRGSPNSGRPARCARFSWATATAIRPLGTERHTNRCSHTGRTSGWAVATLPPGPQAGSSGQRPCSV